MSRSDSQHFVSSVGAGVADGVGIAVMDYHNESQAMLVPNHTRSSKPTFAMPAPSASGKRRHQTVRRSASNVGMTRSDDARRHSRKPDAGDKSDAPIFIQRYSFSRSESDGVISHYVDKQRWAESFTDNNKAIKLLGVDMDAIERAKCLRMMGVTEDDYQKSIEVFQVFNKIDAVKSGTNATKKAQQLLGVDDLSLKLYKPFRTLGIDRENIDREKMMALSLLGSDQADVATQSLNDHPKAGSICSCSPMQRRPSF